MGILKNTVANAAPQGHWLKYTGYAIAAYIVLSSTIYIVDPSEMANIRRMGNVIYQDPVGAGPHLKIPFIDTVDIVQISLTTLHIPPFDVNTVDNQKITLDMNFNYTIPRNKVNHLLYEVGKTGSADITESIIPVVRDRAGRIFNRQNTTMISQNREVIQENVTQAVFKAMTEQFGLQPHSLQIAQIIYSPTFVQSNENAVRAKNDAVAEQNKQVVETAKAQQKVIAAKGLADSAIESATGSAKSAVIRAQADKTKQVLDGEGQAARLKLEISAFNNNPELYIRYLQARAQLQWNGQSPQVVGGANSQQAVVVPLPMSSGVR